MGKAPFSLTRRLLLVLIAPTTALAVMLGFGGVLMINRIVEGVNDRVLGASVRIIAETVAVEDGHIIFDLPPWALGMLETDLRNNIYYSVSIGDELVSGYDLPEFKPLPGRDGDVDFQYSEYLGSPVRVAATREQVSGMRPAVVIQIAETLDTRKLLQRRMVGGLLVFELLVLGLLVLLLPPAVRWGLAPLASLRRDLERRAPADFTPLPLHDVPLELHKLVIGFNEQLARLERAVKAMRQFTADAAHQMRTPLSILRTHLNVLESSGLRNPDQNQHLEDMRTATDRLQRLLTQLLALARAESAKEGATRVMQAVDIVAIARTVTEEHVPAAVRANQDLQFSTSRPVLMVQTQAQLATELLANILDNAIRYNQPRGQVHIELRAVGDNIVVAVEDSGPGIAESQREEVFSRFFRLERDQVHPGSGLGLAIVKEIAIHIGAKIQLLDPVSGSGLRVEVTFPAAKP